MNSNFIVGSKLVGIENDSAQQQQQPYIYVAAGTAPPPSQTIILRCSPLVATTPVCRVTTSPIQSENPSMNTPKRNG
uniref:Uncharacterized protein n=1 Tax=Acrobeloides nanus TaxID=290746 RepID=A0A914C0X6_9BILA